MFRQRSLSRDFTDKIIAQAAGKVTRDVLESFLYSVENEIKRHYFTKSSESNLLRILQYQYDPAFLINESTKFPHLIEILITISNNSNYLSDILVKNPEYFFWAANASTLNQKVAKQDYSRILKNSIEAYKSFDAKVNIIRNFKRREILRIGLKDIYLKAELSTITKLLSDLALAISAQLFKLCYEQVLKKYGIIKTGNKYTLFALGKLGGRELNYSSDIDLIAFYEKDSLLDKKVYYKQVLSETILLFIETASKKTGSGFLYRVDFRLRPDGRNSPLCGSYSEYIKYYEMRGEDWERQMLIKADFVCGSKSIFDNFYDYLIRFIYPSGFLTSPLEQIRKLKSGIEKRSYAADNIKLASGGIRDIEFSVQALQLINGGKDKSVRSGNTLEAISFLRSGEILTENEYESLTNSYTIYRKIEHYVQLMNDQQTHIIPSDGELAEKLSSYLGYKDLSSLKDHLSMLRKNIKLFFNSVLGEGEEIRESGVAGNVKFRNIKRAGQNLNYLRTGKSILEKKQFDVRTIDAFEKTEEFLFGYLRESPDPDLVLENFVRVIKSAHYPRIWYEEFIDKKFFGLFLQLCEFSQKAIDIFAEDKLLRDEFLSRESLLNPDSSEQTVLSLKSFHFRCALQLITGNLSPEEFPKLYSLYLEGRIKSLVSGYSADKDWKESFFISAMGSFGAEELSFNSDLDLIIIVRNPDAYADIQKDFQKLLHLFRSELPGVEIDCRLRPEGKSSMLVWDLDNYKKYFNDRARTWELHAFTKCRFLCGKRDLFGEFINCYIGTVQQRSVTDIKSEMIGMRRKLLPISDGTFNIRKSPGGLTDIDFITGYLLLKNPRLMNLRLSAGSIDSISILRENSDLNIDFENLIQGFGFLKKLELINQNTFNTRISKVPSDEKLFTKLKRAMELCGIRDLTGELNSVTNHIKKEYQKTFS